MIRQTALEELLEEIEDLRKAKDLLERIHRSVENYNNKIEYHLWLELLRYFENDDDD